MAELKTGWIKLHRSLLDWEWWDDHNSVRILIWLLVSVNYEQKIWKGITINPGQIVTSLDKISLRTGLTIKQCRLALDRLDGKEIERKRAGKGQLITIIKWDSLQSDDEKRAGKGQATGQEKGRKRATTKEGKEIQEDNNNLSIDIDKFSFKQKLIDYGFHLNLIEDWLKVRKDKKASNTETALNKFISQVELSGKDKNEILKLCVEKSWKGFEAAWLKNLNENYGKSNIGGSIKSGAGDPRLIGRQNYD